MSLFIGAKEAKEMAICVWAWWLLGCEREGRPTGWTKIIDSGS